MAKPRLPKNDLSARIVTVRDRRAMIDADLATLYGVSTKVFNQAVKRNRKRFPADFVFRLRVSEKKELVTNCDQLGALKFSAQLPYAFTEHGAIMAAMVLRSKLAVQMSVYVVRAFMQQRVLLASHRELAAKIAAVEAKLGDHDSAIRNLLDLMRSLMAEPKPTKRSIGFVATEE